ncbi:Uncharacterised protein [Kingella potus]|uniref:DUF4124 domain-containing protein n=1 Tax=Kingella potus TaxID=265175 RepID=A0A377R1E0_9NEIS|nr:hypothetical protein [Kingella potus]UOP00913.1 hypothetical protein LVJ84_00330 [Kingella potus]STR00568.1 Uncharacterised protein [Kingella potus]
MKLFYLPVFTALVFLSAPVQAAYVCGSGEDTVYSSEKTDPSCRESQKRTESAGKADKADIWEDAFFDDLSVLRPAAQTTAEAAPKMTVKLRNSPPPAAAKTSAPAKAPVRAAAPIYAAVKPKLTRDQILQKEISSERAALVRTRDRLEQALKQGGNAAPLQRAVADREANIRAIERELKKF